MNHKRRKPRRKVKCNLCTDGRNGNSKKTGTGKRARVTLSKKLNAAEWEHAMEELFGK